MSVAMLSRSNVRLLTQVIGRLQEITKDAAETLEAACKKGEFAFVLHAFCRCSMEWTTCFSFMYVLCELSQVHVKPKEFFRAIEKTRHSDLMYLADVVRYEVLPLAKEFPDMLQVMKDELLRLDIQQAVSSPCTHKRRNELLLVVNKLLKKDLEKTITEYEFEYSEIPIFEPPVDLLRIRGMQGLDGYFFGDDGYPDHPLEALSACAARIYRAYKDLLPRLETLGDERGWLTTIEKRLQTNVEFINVLLEKELADGRSGTSPDRSGDDNARPECQGEPAEQGERAVACQGAGS